MRGYKKQFRLYDIYRCAVLDKHSFILGIENYEVDKNADLILVDFVDGRHYRFIAKDEEDLKQIIKEVNKMLGTCKKPGKRRKENVAQ